MSLKSGDLVNCDKRDHAWKACSVVLSATSLVCTPGREDEQLDIPAFRLNLGPADVGVKEFQGETDKGWARKVMVQAARNPHFHLEITPDHARNSKYSKRQAFSVCAMGQEVLLAASNAEEMWAWCKAIWNRGAGVADQREALGSVLNKLCQQKSATKAEVQELLLLGADVDWRDWRGGTALMRAARCIEGVARAQVVALLLSAGADVNATALSGATALLSLCQPVHEATRPALVEALLSRKASVHSIDETMGNLLSCLVRCETEKSGASPEDIQLASRVVELGVGAESNQRGQEAADNAKAERATVLQLQKFARPREGTWMHRQKWLTVNDGMTKVPEVVRQMPWLVTLDLSENTIFSLPPHFFENLLNLESLDLSFNCLVALPHDIGRCQKMNTLRLVANRLTTLPAELGKLGALEELELGMYQSLFGNPILDPAPDVWERRGQVPPFRNWGVSEQSQISRKGLGFPKRQARDELLPKQPPAQHPKDVTATGAGKDSSVQHMDVHSIHHPALVLVEEDNTICGESSASHVRRVQKYLLATLLSGSVENWSLTMPVVGVSEAGKTSLINAIVEGVSRLTRVGDRTVGVEQRQWGLPVQLDGAERTLDLRISDFAGQSEYLFTHHLFLRPNGLCVVAFDLHKYRPRHFHRMLLQFVEVLQSRVPGSVILLVGTHADMASQEVQQERCAQVLRMLQQRQAREHSRLQEEIQSLAEAKQKLIEEEMARVRSERGELDPDDPAAKHDFAEQIEYMHLMRQVMAPDQHGGRIASEVAALEKRHEQLQRQANSFLKLPSRVHAISSRTMQGMTDLIEDIKTTALNKENFPRMGQTIPRVYMDVRDCIREWKVAMPYCPKEQLMAMLLEDLSRRHCESEHGTLLEVVSDALEFHHQLGELVSYNDIDGAAGTVFLSLPWLVDVLKHLIRHDHSDSLVFEAPEDGQHSTELKSEPEFAAAKAELLKRGYLSLTLLRYLWRSMFPSGLSNMTLQSLISVVCLFDVAILVGADSCATDAFGSTTAYTEKASSTISSEQLLVPVFFPMQLPPTSWPLLLDTGSSGIVQARRWLALSAVPSGLVSSLQARLYRHPYFQQTDRASFIFAKEGLAITTQTCCLLVRPHIQGYVEEGPGLEVIGRATGGTELWAAVTQVVSCAEGLLNQWKGITCTVFVELETDTGVMIRVPDIDLQLARARGQQHFTCSTSAKTFALDMLLGPPAAPVLPLPLRFDFPGLEMTEMTEFAAAWRLTQVMQKRGVPWVMLSYDPESRHMALQTYRKLTEKRIPTWLDFVAGTFASPAEAIRTGVEGALIVMPLYTNKYLNSPHCMKCLALAQELSKTVMAVVAESGLETCTVESTTVPFSNPCIQLTNDIGDDEFRKRFDELVNLLDQHHLAPLPEGILQSLDGQDSLHAIADSLADGREQERRLLSDQSQEHQPHSGCEGNGVSEDIQRWLLDAGLEQEDAVKYATAFVDAFGFQSVGDIYGLSFADLSSVGLTAGYKRRLLSALHLASRP